MSSHYVLYAVFSPWYSCEAGKRVCSMEEAKKLSIAQCRKVLEESGVKYSDEQVLKIRDILYDLGELDYLIFKEMLKSGTNTGFDQDSNKAA